MSYAPDILIKIDDDIVMSLSCTDSCVGVGFKNLVKWKQSNSNDDSKKNDMSVESEPDLYAMIHICDAFNLMSKVNIRFGTKKYSDATINDIHIEIRDRIKCKSYVLYKWSRSINNSNSSNLQHLMPEIGDLHQNNPNNANYRKRSLSNHDTNLSSPPPSKKRKIN